MGKDESLEDVMNNKACRFIRKLKSGRPQTIVAYGTSLTAGASWVGALQGALIAKYPKLAKVINSGEGEKCSIWGLQNLNERVIAKMPDAVFIEFSINDAHLPYKMTLDDSKNNLNKMA